MFGFGSSKKRLEKEQQEKALRDAFEAQRKRNAGPSACTQPPYAFQTIDGNYYIVNPGKALIWGGTMLVPEKYDFVEAKIGARAKIKLRKEYRVEYEEEDIGDRSIKRRVKRSAPAFSTIDVIRVWESVPQEALQAYMEISKAINVPAEGLLDLNAQQRMQDTKKRIQQELLEKQNKKEANIRGKNFKNRKR